MESAKSNILVAEDASLVAEALASRLQEICSVHIAGTSEEAYRLSHSMAFAAAVVDLTLPKTEGGRASSSEGLAFIQQFQQSHPGAPIVVHSAFVQSNRERLRQLGVSYVVPKEDVHSLDAVRAAINSVITGTVARPAPLNAIGSSSVLDHVRRIVAQELEHFLGARERTLLIPDEGRFDLIKPLIGYRRDIERHLSAYPYANNVFLMMKYRDSNRDLSDFIMECLQKAGLRGVRADLPEWNITGTVYNPIAVLYCCKYGIALFDEPEQQQAYNPNVAYELGMMHCQGKECLLLKHDGLPAVPFDLIKDLHSAYSKDLQVRRIIEQWTKQIAATRLRDVV